MSLALVAAKAALMRKQANAGRLALGLGALGGAGLAAGAGVNEMVAPVVEDDPEAPTTYAGRKRAGKMDLRDQVRDEITSTAATTGGNFLKRWYGNYTGGAPQ